MSFLHDLNPSQQEAVRTVDGPVMVVAGAGSGKTRVLTYRIAHLINSGVPAYRILALTFTNKAAGEMKKRVVSLVGGESTQVWMGTFHSIFARMLRAECERLGYTRNFTIYDSDDSLSMIRGIERSFGLSSQQYNPHAMRARISAAKNRCTTPDEYASQATDLFEEKTAVVYKEYQRRLSMANAMDFDDLLIKPIELFQKNKRVLEAHQERFRYILVDEYQDTNRAQYIALKLLAGKYRNICVVGDDAQSIYAFRGAEIRNILDFENEYPDCKTFRLEQNYRSTKTILAAAGHVIKQNVDQIQKTLWTENPHGEPVSLLVCEDDKDEGHQIVSRLQQEILRHKFELKDVAVLYRTNAQSRSLEDAFRRNGIPYVIVGGVEFYKRREIKDVLAYLRLIVNPKDDESLLRVINVPARGIGDKTIERLRFHAEKKKLTLLEAVSDPDLTDNGGLAHTTAKKLKTFGSLIGKYRALREKLSANELARVLVDELGILKELKSEGTADALARWENVQELLSAIAEFVTDRPDAQLETFLEEVSLISDVDKWDETRNAVTLMTAHAAKGLEFPVVLISGLEEGLFPLYATVVDRKELEEERRLFYVAMTRARRKLYLSYARLRFRFGAPSFQSPSRFLEEIGDQNVIVERPAGAYSERMRSGRQESARWRPKQPRKASQTHAESEFFSDAHPDYENETQEVSEIHVGTRVEHEAFGRGKVVEMIGKGDQARAVVEFTSVGRKHLLLRYANLRLI
jgi:DNA helicase-2/ATP-dependent DNA helicase PcrA